MSELIACPVCGVEMPIDNLRGQGEHMQEKHPEVIEKRLEDAGFEKRDGKWVDTLVDDDPQAVTTAEAARELAEFDRDKA